MLITGFPDRGRGMTVVFMHIKDITNQPEVWDTFVKQQPHTLFVQSPHYADFYRAMGERAWILGLFRDGELLGGSLVVSTHAKRGSYLYLPYGPVFDRGANNQQIKAIYDYIKELGKKGQYDFIRISPFIQNATINRQLFQTLGCRPAPMHVLAESTWLLDVSPSEEELIANMNKNHRNLIRRCEREGVRVEHHTDNDALERFHKLLDQTAKRHNFHRFSKEYINAEFNSFAPHGEALLFEAYLPDGRLDGSAVIMFYGTMACYRHSASLNLNPKLPTAYAIQWAVIKEAKRRGIMWYNLWGVATEGSSPKHPFAGITHFKKGFGGEGMELLHCHDFPLTIKYLLNWVVESARRVRRGF